MRCPCCGEYGLNRFWDPRVWFCIPCWRSWVEPANAELRQRWDAVREKRIGQCGHQHWREYRKPIRAKA